MNVCYSNSYESVLALATTIVVDNPRSPIMPVSCAGNNSNNCNTNSTSSSTNNNNETVPPLVPFAKCSYHRKKRVRLGKKGNDDRDNSNNDNNADHYHYHQHLHHLHHCGHDVTVKKKTRSRAVTQQQQQQHHQHQHQQEKQMIKEMCRHGTDMFDNYSGTIRKNTFIMPSSSSSSLLKNGSCYNTSRTRLTGTTTICNDLAPKMPCRRLSIQSTLDVLTESLRICGTMANDVDQLSTSSYPCDARQ